MTPEGRIRAHLRKQTLANGGQHRKLGWIGRRNAPDELIFWHVPPGHPPIAALVECKRKGEDPTAAQVREHARLTAGGFRVEVVDSELYVDLLISELTGEVKSAWITASGKEWLR